MIKVTYKLNVDTLIVEDTIVSVAIGDIVVVKADFTPDPASTSAAPIGWSIGQVPTPPLRTHVLELISEDGHLGTMTFKAVTPGDAWVEYRMTDPVRSKETHFAVS